MRDRPQIPDYYSVLGIGFDASQDELRRAWRAAQKQWHPDRNPTPEADQKIREVNAAWEVLGDPERRAEYDSIYFAVRARIAEEERRAHEAERLERESRERLRQQELERKMRAEAEARRRAEEAEQRRKAEERKRKAEEERERKRQERALAEKRAEAVAEARRRAEEEDRRDRERRRREEENAEEARKREARDGAEDAMPGGGNGRLGQPSGATARGGRGGWMWGFATVAVLTIVAIVAAFIVVGNRTTMEDESVVVVLVTATRVPTPTLIPPTATAVPPTATTVPTPTVTPTPTPRLVIIYVTATPTPTVRPLPTARPRPTPRPTATPRPTPVPTRRPAATPTPRPTQVPNPSPTPKPRYQGSPLDLHDLLDSDQVTLDQVRALLESGAPVSAANIAGESPLTVAAKRGRHANILSLLIAHGADPSRNPFILHALLRNSDVSSSQVLTLLQHGAQIDSEDINGLSPLEVAVANEQSVRVLRVLLFNGAKLYKSPTILHALLSTGAATAEKVKLLIDAGASGTATDLSGNTPLDVALARGLELDSSILVLLGHDDTNADASIRSATPTATPGTETGQAGTTAPPCLPRSDVPCYPEVVLNATPTPISPRELTIRSELGSMASRHGEGYLGCPALTTDSEFISSATRMGVVEFDFVVPRVARWSIGVLYHVGSNASTDSATMTFRDGAGPLKVGHWTRANGVNVNLLYPVSVEPGLVEALPGDIVKFEFATDNDGTTLTLDGVEVLAVPSGDLRPLAGPMQMCVGFWSSELLDYGIEYKRLRAWSE